MGVEWELGALRVYGYGAVMAAAGLAAMIWTARRLPRTERGAASWFALLGVPLMLICARAGYALCVVDQVEFAFLWDFTQGGYLLWGAVLGCLAAAGLTARLTRLSMGTLLDAVCVPACLLIAAARVAAGLMAEQGLGMSLESWIDPEETDWAYRYSLLRLEDWGWLERLPFAWAPDGESWYWAVFTLEALWALAMIPLLQQAKVRCPGGRAALMVLLYAAPQITLEAMKRGEVLYLPHLGFVRANQILCAVALLALWAVCRRESGARASLGSLGLLLLGAGIVVAMEFAAFEKKITMIEWLPADGCHLVMALGCLLMALALRPMWRRSFAAARDAA